MKRREFLKVSAGGIMITATPSVHAFDIFAHQATEDTLSLIQQESCADALVDPSFLEPREDDIITSPQEFKLLKSLYKRIYRVQKTVGYGHFNTLNFDEMIKIGKWYSRVGRFTQAEIDYFEELFYESASNYGFYGKKVISNMTNQIKRRDIVKVKHTGHYLFKDHAVAKYEKIRKEMGNRVILTSGVRNIVKQTYLFLNKAVRTNGNLSIASRSLAPAGYSYHGVSDFDIGKVGFGAKNFTSAFAKTQEFKKLIRLGYIDIRYPKNNPFGVRFEPWHIKVYSDT